VRDENRAYDGVDRMRRRSVRLLLAAALTLLPSSVASFQSVERPPPECHEWQECRQLALAAREGGQFERFHDLAWRTVQTGPPNDPALMYLLARAQALSGRPHDALIMLGRLAEKGVVATDARTEADFERVRLLPRWREFDALMDRTSATAAAAPATAVTPPGVAPSTVPPGVAPVTTVPAIPPRSALKFEPRPSEDVARLSASPFVASGLAYDAVSRRSLVGDALGRRVVVVGDGSGSAVDLVRAASAQFHDVTALEIDARRGDLWVASTAPDSGDGALHRLQLISGRPLAIIEPPSELEPVKLIDIAVVPDGTILVLDSVGPRVIGAGAGAKTLVELAPLDVSAPASIAAGADDRTAYVAHRDGIVRLDLELRSATPLSAPEGIELGGFERIRWHRDRLVGVQALADGSRRIVRLQLTRDRTVAEAAVIATGLGPGAGPTFATVAGDDMYYVVAPGDGAPSTVEMVDVVVKRIRLP
jgi:hypothetical protein